VPEVSRAGTVRNPTTLHGAIVVLLLVALTALVLWIVYRITNR
jgi:tetrahydromethanopterin S-methyltransferase subunit B